MTETPVNVFPVEQIHHHGQNYNVELRQHRLCWEAYCPALGVGATSEGPNQAVRALQSKLKEAQ